MDKEKSLRLFSEEIRKTTLEILDARGFGHIGGIMSVVEMVAVLYDGVMKINPSDPNWNERDRLVMSKGHAGPTLYAALYLKGYFEKDVLTTLNREGTSLPSHCDKNKTIGVDMTTGSLGQGISTAIGLALGQRLDGNGARTYVCLGDGECNEGQIWEGFMLACHQKLDNLTIFIDYNGQQLDGYLKDVLDMGDLAAKCESFGLYTQSIDGHDVKAVQTATENAIDCKGKASVIILNTKKGNGCTFAQGVEANHHIAFTKEQMNEALAQAQQRLDQARQALS